MNLENCFICKRPVLEFSGQFEKLDTYLLNEDDAAYEQGAFGWCHTSCLSKSRWGAFWAERRIWHLTSVKGFPKLHSDVSLTVVCNPRTDERIVLRADGVSFSIKPSMLEHKKDCPDGILLPIFEEMNLELDEPKLTREIRDTLAKTKYFPLQKLVKALELNDYLLYPEAIIDGALRFNKALKQEWVDNWVSADVSYNQFIPQEVLEPVLST
jgi:hypothetical protein